MKIVHEYDDKGNHRIGVSRKTPGNLCKDASFQYGKWVSYQHPAIFPLRKSKLVICTDFFTGSDEFPYANTVYKVADTGFPVSVTLAANK